ncbi:hypothetical protein [Mycobacterium sp. ITM-2016-00318]|uniref:hypothetical protein n=1 Tax=Mycobacterium sp. ITM-2016-00318 TaxID=2099693 RepID=UPI0026AD56C4|nr:hypothetical protein [Mycobacterium sp. ITM-2016-00318]WNG92857.1 hypothetical protein C6A82_026460 [Mycobacterium sp. ITM-2016-00318]
MPEGDTVYALARRLDEALRDRVLTHGELRGCPHMRRRTSPGTPCWLMSRTASIC